MTESMELLTDLVRLALLPVVVWIAWLNDVADEGQVDE